MFVVLLTALAFVPVFGSVSSEGAQWCHPHTGLHAANMVLATFCTGILPYMVLYYVYGFRWQIAICVPVWGILTGGIVTCVFVTRMWTMRQFLGYTCTALFWIVTLPFVLRSLEPRPGLQFPFVLPFIMLGVTCVCYDLLTKAQQLWVTIVTQLVVIPALMQLAKCLGAWTRFESAADQSAAMILPFVTTILQAHAERLTQSRLPMDWNLTFHCVIMVGNVLRVYTYPTWSRWLMKVSDHLCCCVPRGQQPSLSTESEEHPDSFGGNGTSKILSVLSSNTIQLGTILGETYAEPLVVLQIWGLRVVCAVLGADLDIRAAIVTAAVMLVMLFIQALIIMYIELYVHQHPVEMLMSCIPSGRMLATLVVYCLSVTNLLMPTIVMRTQHPTLLDQTSTWVFCT